MTDHVKLRLDLPLILPDVDDAQDRCVTRLIDALSGRPGIAEAHVIGRDSGAPELCVHYDPDTISLARVRELAQSVGAQLTSRFAHLLVRADVPLHARAARNVADSLRDTAGVLEADVAAAGVLRVEYDRSLVSERTLLEKAAALGVRGVASADGGEGSAPAVGVRPADEPVEGAQGKSGMPVMSTLGEARLAKGRS